MGDREIRSVAADVHNLVADEMVGYDLDARGWYDIGAQHGVSGERSTEILRTAQQAMGSGATRSYVHIRHDFSDALTGRVVGMTEVSPDAPLAELSVNLTPWLRKGIIGRMIRSAVSIGEPGQASARCLTWVDTRLQDHSRLLEDAINGVVSIEPPARLWQVVSKESIANSDVIGFSTALWKTGFLGLTDEHGLKLGYFDDGQSLRRRARLPKSYIMVRAA